MTDSSMSGFEVSSTSFAYLHAFFKEHVTCKVLRIEYHLAPPLTDECQGVVKVRFRYTIAETECALDVSILINVRSHDMGPDVAVYAKAHGQGDDYDSVDCRVPHSKLYTEEFVAEMIESLEAYAETVGDNE